MIKKIVIVAEAYPTDDDPVYTFIRPVACGLADLGVEIVVISPQSITNAIKRRVKIRPYYWTDYTDQGNKIHIYQPRHISVSMLKYKDCLISQRFYETALRRAFKKLNIKPDLVYAHFWESVVAASYAIGENNIPLVAVSGEERVAIFEKYPRKHVEAISKKVKGMICVSTKNLEECMSLGLVHNKLKTIILPNSINSKIFYPLSQKEAREKLHLDPNYKIAIFVGEFSNRKGVNRVLEAAKSIPELKLILIGSGDPLIESDQILYCGTLPHYIIPLYLNASDFFVLPTLAEGCCNAIVEALACGLPIISSDRSFNYDILDDSNSILINPNNTDEIADALRKLYYSPDLCESLSKGALTTSKALRIEERVQKIKQFLDDIIC